MSTPDSGSPLPVLRDRIWSERVRTAMLATIPYCIRKCRETGRLENFSNAANPDKSAHSGHSYDDSDVYKVIEGIGRALMLKPDAALEEEADALIALIVSAQEDGGYLNTKFSAERGSAFRDFDEHEMYDCGHLIEAGISYHRATGKPELLDAARRFADHLMRLFGPGKREWIPGHQEIELALAKLSEHTGEKRYSEFARWLLDRRGSAHPDIDGSRKIDREYCQDLEPPAELRSAYGHAVRALYMLAAMAALTREGSADYREALDSVWRDMVERKMYVTGGLGSSSKNEGFSEAYHLPNEDAYCETCAAVGMALLSRAMFLLDRKSEYFDMVERVLFNAVLPGMSAEGDRFFYRNTLESKGDIHRKEWFSTACCPTQLSRFLPSVGEYIYFRSGGALYVNLFIANETPSVTVISEYPYSGIVRIEGKKTEGLEELRVRIPSWAKQVEEVRKCDLEPKGIESGYLRYSVLGDFRLELDFHMAVEIVQSHPLVEANRGKAAVRYGPLVFCMEGRENEEFDSFALSDDQVFILEDDASFPIFCRHLAVVDRGTGKREATLVPYYLWDNRGMAAMKVFMPLRESGRLYR